MRTTEEIELRRQWALDHYFPPRAAAHYANCEEDEEEDWIEWYEARQRSAHNFIDMLRRNLRKE